MILLGERTTPPVSEEWRGVGASTSILSHTEACSSCGHTLYWFKLREVEEEDEYGPMLGYVMGQYHETNHLDEVCAFLRQVSEGARA